MFVLFADTALLLHVTQFALFIGCFSAFPVNCWLLGAGKVSDGSVYATWHLGTERQIVITVTNCYNLLPCQRGSPSLEPWASLILFLQAIPLRDQDPFHKLLCFILCRAHAILLPNIPDGVITVNIISPFLRQEL